MSGIDDRNIILIGYRGTGKTSVGRELSRRLNRLFLDTDELTETREGRSIRKMVEKEGWPFFREQEKETIRSLQNTKNCVIATGGGAVLDPENEKLLKSMGWIVLLTASEEVIVRRISSDPASRGQRPSFKAGETNEDSEETMRRETVEILRQRMPIYRRLADFTIDTSQDPTDRIVNEILRALSAGHGSSDS